MNNIEREALYKEALEFSQKDDNSAAGRAAKQLAEALAEKLNSKKFGSGDFTDDCVAFLTVKPDKLNSLDKGVIIKFITKCKENKANEVVERFADICTSSFFDISYKQLAFLGAQLADAGFNDDGARCFERVTKMIRETGVVQESQD